MKIALKQTSEYGALRTVVMCLAHPFDVDLDALAAVDPVVRRQMAANRYRGYDVDKVHEQQHELAAVLESCGAQVLFAEHVLGAGGQHYTRDIGFVIGDVFFEARPRATFRRREIEGLAKILPKLPRVCRLKSGRIEGGDVLVHHDTVFVGLGEETDLAGIEALRSALGEEGLDHHVCPLHFQDRGVIHLDTKLNIVGPELAVADPTAFTKQSLAVIESHFELIVATPEETRSLDINFLVVSERAVAMSAQSHRLAAELAARGITPIPIDYSEVTALPGSFRCTTLPLERE